MKKNPKIAVAFRFHVNFYHSYRGDTPDENGFGKDIRIIRQIIDMLDDYNRRGVNIRGTWDIENYYSLEKIIPEYCPDILESWQRRVADGLDEIEFMSYNNGLLSASTPEEFDRAVSWADTNPSGSGLSDLFARRAPVVRPQEMMYTPSFLRLYPEYGIDALSLYYSAIPFTAFTCFIPPLPPEQRYNPVTLTAPGGRASMTVIPAYNHGDLIDHLSLRRWVKKMRAQQMAMKDPKDFLLLIDLDADDEFWLGFDVPLLPSLFKVLRGLPGLVESIQDLDYIRFDTPGRYLEDHAPVGTVAVGQDTADGSFDGYSSWAEKWSNHQLWTAIDRARLCGIQAQRLIKAGYGEARKQEVEQLLENSLQKRVLLLSTTHFGMAAPVVNTHRLQAAGRMATDSLDYAGRALEIALTGTEEVSAGCFRLLDIRRVSSPSPVPAVLRFTLARPMTAGAVAVTNGQGAAVPSAIVDDGKEVIMLCRLKDKKEQTFFLQCTDSKPGEQEVAAGGLECSSRCISTPELAVIFDDHHECVYAGPPVEKMTDHHPFMTSGFTYRGRERIIRQWDVLHSGSPDGSRFAVHRSRGCAPLPGMKDKAVSVQREFLLVAGLPWFYLTITVSYPGTPHKGFNRGQAKRLGQTWDNRWSEVFPCRLFPNIMGTPAKPLRVWKQNYFGDLSYYDLNYASFSRNGTMDSSNNQITGPWMAITDGGFGFLLSQSPEVLSSMAFCPLRTRRIGGFDRVFLNPFGTWYGTQPYYPTAATGLGRLAAVSASASDHLRSYAPSYNGRTETFRLLVAPYAGDTPPEELRQAAELFASPPVMIDPQGIFEQPGIRRWVNPFEKE